MIKRQYGICLRWPRVRDKTKERAERRKREVWTFYVCHFSLFTLLKCLMGFFLARKIYGGGIRNWDRLGQTWWITDVQCTYPKDHFDSLRMPYLFSCRRGWSQRKDPREKCVFVCLAHTQITRIWCIGHFDSSQKKTAANENPVRAEITLFCSFRNDELKHQWRRMKKKTPK